MPVPPTRSALVVSRDFGGFLRLQLCGFVAPRSRSWGSPGFQPSSRHAPEADRPHRCVALRSVSFLAAVSLSPGSIPSRRWASGLRLGRRPQGFVPPKSSRSRTSVSADVDSRDSLGLCPTRGLHRRFLGFPTNRLPMRRTARAPPHPKMCAGATTFPEDACAPRSGCRDDDRVCGPATEVARPRAPSVPKDRPPFGGPSPVRAAEAARCDPLRVHSPRHLTEVLAETRRYLAGASRVFGTFKDHTG